MDMGKERKGSIVERAGKLYVRINYTDSLGKRRELMRRAQNKRHARKLKKQLVKQLDSAEENPRRTGRAETHIHQSRHRI
jgi:hypothetical protein